MSNATKLWSKKLKLRANLGELDLQQILGEKCVNVYTGLNWLRIRPKGELLRIR